MHDRADLRLCYSHIPTPQWLTGVEEARQLGVASSSSTHFLGRLRGLPETERDYALFLSRDTTASCTNREPLRECNTTACGLLRTDDCK
jgi:hypothetical protein